MLGSLSDLITSAQSSLGDATGSATDVSDLVFGSLQDIIGADN
ncbi:hypothetical protein [Tomitella cavernea]|uniref:Uncharacterized protein n=1 Tax=Tomitella cavernea TaxID=1387982 RepID=A0ABP9D5U9_9ACTN|nr:hypothetical protein [Tomitella cavernea]